MDGDSHRNQSSRCIIGLRRHGTDGCPGWRVSTPQPRVPNACCHRIRGKHRGAPGTRQHCKPGGAQHRVHAGPGRRHRALQPQRTVGDQNTELPAQRFEAFVGPRQRTGVGVGHLSARACAPRFHRNHWLACTVAAPDRPQRREPFTILHAFHVETDGTRWRHPRPGTRRHQPVPGPPGYPRKCRH